ncbi:JmjC domain-containing protein [Nocardiopsis baichengensis]|uniref:JmjC domain-containing protein n=1 Tax=Nocardiopsis baichengensis TaxID=280240 RepID=UPI000345CAB4|nr:cupin domain-containing protein [Nocardiopsis baichengensis]
MSQTLFTGAVRAAIGEDALRSRLSDDVIFADVGEEAVRHLLDLGALDEILATRPLAPPRLRLHREGAPVPAERYTEAGEVSRESTRVVRPEGLYRELRGGASMVLDSIDRLHPPVREAADDLMRLVRERAQVNLYLIWGGSHGFATHWDDHDTFIVQVAGEKAWQVHGQGSRPYPMKVDSDHSHTPPEGTVWEGVLRPGHVLHVPRGWWHTVTGTGGMSMHLTFGFTRATGVDWARSLIERLYGEEVFRRDLPRFASADERRKRHDELVRVLAALAEDSGVDGFLEERDARFPRRRSYSLGWAVEDGREPAPDTVVEFVPLLAPPTAAEDGKVAVTVSGRRYRFPAAAEPVLRVLARDRRLTAGELAERSGTDPGALSAVLRAFVRHHLVVMR